MPDLSGSPTLDRTAAEPWSRYLPPAADVRRRGAVLRRRRRVGASLAGVGAAAAVVGVTVIGVPGSASPAANTPAIPAGGFSTLTTPSHPAAMPTPPPPTDPMPKDSTVVGSGVLGSHQWTVRVARGAPGSVVWANYDHGVLGGRGTMPTIDQAPAIPDGTTTRLDPWYGPGLGVVSGYVADDVVRLEVDSRGGTVDYPTVPIAGRRFVAFPVTGPGDVVGIVAYDSSGHAVGSRKGRFLPYGVFPQQLPPTDPRRDTGSWVVPTP